MHSSNTLLDETVDKDIIIKIILIIYSYIVRLGMLTNDPLLRVDLILPAVILFFGRHYG